MRLQFLCPQHREALSSRPATAADFWRESQERLRETDIEATPGRVSLAGSALEAAGIYLNACGRCQSEDIERYTDTALSLIDLLAQLQQRRLALVVVAGANAMVEQLAQWGGDKMAAVEASRRLTQEGMHRVEPLWGLKVTPGRFTATTPTPVAIH
ncbi:MAG: hypothetical protein AAF098_15165 [Pseudomonadota bacterium]